MRVKTDNWYSLVLCTWKRLMFMQESIMLCPCYASLFNLQQSFIATTKPWSTSDNSTVIPKKNRAYTAPITDLRNETVSILPQSRKADGWKICAHPLPLAPSERRRIKIIPKITDSGVWDMYDVRIPSLLRAVYFKLLKPGAGNGKPR